jgi:predicted permease
MGLLGFYLVRKGLVNQDAKNFLPRFVVGYALPLYLFSTAIKELSRGDLPGLLTGTALAVVTMTLTLILAMVFIRVLKVRQGRQGLFAVGFTFSNTMFLGLPINVALFGESALPFVISYFFSNSLMFWTVGSYLMSLDGPGQKSQIFSLETVKRFFNPPLTGFLIGLFLVVLEIPIPGFVASSARMLGSTTTPLAIIFIGMSLADLDLKSLRLEKDIVFVMLGRFLICPLITMTLCLAVNLSPGLNRVFIIQSSLPVLANCSIMAGYYRSDTSFAVLIVSLTTTLSLFTVPLFRLLVSFI